MMRLVVFLGVATLLGGCGVSANVGSSALPRQTREGVVIRETVATETLPLPGCSVFWETVKKTEPPTGACEQDAQVTTFTAFLGSRSVTTTVIGESARLDPLLVVEPMTPMMATDGLVLVVLAPTYSGIASLRMVDEHGRVHDEVLADRPLVTLAAEGQSFSIEALDGSGHVVGTCPPDGVTIDAVTYQCSPAPDATLPVTTTTIATD